MEALLKSFFLVGAPIKALRKIMDWQQIHASDFVKADCVKAQGGNISVKKSAVPLNSQTWRIGDSISSTRA